MNTHQTPIRERIGTAVGADGQRRVIRRVSEGRNFGVVASAKGMARGLCRPHATSSTELLADFAAANPGVEVTPIWEP